MSFWGFGFSILVFGFSVFGFWVFGVLSFGNFEFEGRALLVSVFPFSV